MKVGPRLLQKPRENRMNLSKPVPRGWGSPLNRPTLRIGVRAGGIDSLGMERSLQEGRSRCLSRPVFPGIETA